VQRVARRVVGKARRTARWASSRPAPRAAVLMYHAVGEVDVDPWGLFVSPSNFAAHVEVLARRARPLRLDQLPTAAAPDGEPTRRGVVVTFDDGYANNLLVARPLLARHGVPATVFVVSTQLDRGGELWWDELAAMVLQPGDLPPRLELVIDDVVVVRDLGAAVAYPPDEWRADHTWRDGDPAPSARMSLYLQLWQRLWTVDDASRRRALRELGRWAGVQSEPRETHRTLTIAELGSLSADGLVTIGSHTETHPLLTSLPHDSIRRELVSSRARLESVLENPIRSFSYPFGAHDDGVVAAVAGSGYDTAVTGRPHTTGVAVDPLRIGRFDVRNWDGDEFERRLVRWLRYH